MSPLPGTLAFAFWLHAHLLRQFTLRIYTPTLDPKKVIAPCKS
jgi:hypothetical protein